MKSKEINQNNQSIYCYPGTSVLVNKRNIKDKTELHKMENMLVNYRLAEVISGKGTFKRDLTIAHYVELHKYLFNDLYEFAGELRQEFTNKTNDEVGEEGIRIYCNPDFIYLRLDEHLKQMKKEAVRIYSREQLVTFLATNYMELYYIHPFREGNSRTLREFLREYVELMDKLLIKFGNFKLEYSSLTDEDRKNFIRATVWNTLNDEEKQSKSITLLENIFSKCLIEYEIGEKTK